MTIQGISLPKIDRGLGLKNRVLRAKHIWVVDSEKGQIIGKWVHSRHLKGKNLG